MSEIQTSPDMNEKIKDILRLGNEPLELYAAQRIEELEKEVQRLKDGDQESKTGHWKHNKCDVCGASRPPLFDNYCPNCGAKMIEPQESEDKE